MDNKSSWSSCTFELEDIEIIDHKNQNEEKSEKWYCDQCSLFFLEKGKLDEHKKKHDAQEIVKCKYCNKTISSSVANRQCYLNRKCETCEYKCAKCPQRFLRHSSLINHEKKHSSPKKKRAMFNNKKVNRIGTKNVAVSKVMKKKQPKTQTDGLEENFKGLKPKKSMNSKNSPKKRLRLQVETEDSFSVVDNSPIKKPKRLSLKAIKSTEERSNSENLPVKVTKRLSLKTSKLSEEEKNSDTKYRQKTSAVDSQAVSPTANVSSTENAVNYKPFSCHICGDTFASDSALLDHIRTHGENAVKSFKCKFCGDEFDDIYKMQYHLAICPLAEDELESSLKQVIPVNMQTKYSGGISSPRKRGRPKRLVESPLDQEYIENESTKSPSKKGSFRKRKSEVLENKDSVPNFTGSSLPKQAKNLQNTDMNRVVEENVTDPLFCEITEVTKENEPDDDRKKLHQCPFPRCDFKFTREKALLCHMRNHSDDFDDSLKCHKCDIPFDDIQTLRLHINTCKGIKEEKDDDFSRAGCYDSSPNRTFQRTKKDFVCIQCGRSHQSQDKLNRCTHEDLQTKGTMVCRICGLETEDEKKLKKHFNSTHPKSFPYQCAICKGEFDSASSEREHRMGHVQKGEQFTCVICSAKFPTYKDLYFHYSKDHVEQSQSICKICNITFPNHMTLEEHNYVMHQSDDRFKCIFCHKAFKSSVYLTTHMKTHTSKIFKCKICYRPFTDMATLFQHMLFHASTLGTERPLKCAVCLAAYAKQSALKYHIGGHITKNTLFNCIICGETMPDNESMSDHIFDHSIRITENNMTKNETKWVKGIKEKKPLVKRRKSSSNNDHEFKSCIKIERDDPEFKPNIKTEGLKSESEETTPLNRNRGRGTQRKMKVEREETPGIKRGRGRPRKQSVNQDSALEQKSVVTMNEGIIQTNQQNYTTRRSARLVEENNSGEFMVNKRTKEEDEEKDVLIKTPKQNNKFNNDECALSTATKSKIASDINRHKANKAKEKNISLTESKINMKRKSIKDKKILSNSDTLYDDSNEVNEAKTPEIVNVSQTSQSENNDGAMPYKHPPPPIQIYGGDNVIENKVRPMSFKFFSSLTNSRGHNLMNKKLKNDKLVEEDVHEGKSSLINSNSLDVKEEMFDDEEDPLGGIEIPYVSARAGLRSSHRFVNGIRDLDCSLDRKKKEITTKHEESDPFVDSESRNSNGFIKEKKYFEPSRGLTKYSCTTCLSTFSSQEELLYHNTTHIL